MELLEEYKKQQTWRNWQSYLPLIPHSPSDIVLDLGCSVGNVSHLFAQYVSHVVGIDLNQEFINFCNSNKRENQTFIKSNFLDVDFGRLPSFSGVWSSFALTYLPQPQPFINRLYHLLPQGGWIAVLDISCFLSGNMSPVSPFYKVVRDFELASYRTGRYDFNFGARQHAILKSAGFLVIHNDTNVNDIELNFDGPANQSVHEVWQARLNRLEGLKQRLGSQYVEFTEEFLAHIGTNEHTTANNLVFTVAVKR